METARSPSLRVLVVDDCVDTTTSLTWLLEMWGHDVRVAHDGPAALEIARAYQPDAVVLDIALRQRWDGYDVARQLRALPGLEHVYLICMSGYVTERDRKRSEIAGFDHFFVKGADPNELEQLLATDGAHRCPADSIAESRALIGLTSAPEVGGCLSPNDGRASTNTGDSPMSKSGLSRLPCSSQTTQNNSHSYEES